MAKIFIGIPTLNRPDYVRGAVQSVLQQSHQDFTILVSDNVSSPENVESVRQYIEMLDDSRVTFHKQSHNVGEYGQGRYFFSKADDCSYFMILHDDDIIMPDYLSRAIELLEQNSHLDYFVANPYIMDIDGKRSEEMTATYLNRHARSRTGDGPIDVLKTHLTADFTPVSGTFFRYAALKQSGFIDDACYGLYPFESNIYLRLGDIKAQAWYSSEELLAFRFHSGSMRSHLSILGNIHVVNSLIYLLGKRRYDGECEHIRRQSLGRLYRAKAIYNIKVNQPGLAIKPILGAMRTYPFSARTLATCLFVMFSQILPRPASKVLPELARQFTTEELEEFRHGLDLSQRGHPSFVE